MVFENGDGVDKWWWCSGGLGCWVLWVSDMLVVDFGSLICGFHMSLCLILLVFRPLKTQLDEPRNLAKLLLSQIN